MQDLRSHIETFQRELAHIRRLIAQADWESRPTLCYRLRAALRRALGPFEGVADIERRASATVRPAGHFANSIRPTHTPNSVELTARIEELEMSVLAAIGPRALDARTSRAGSRDKAA